MPPNPNFKKTSFKQVRKYLDDLAVYLETVGSNDSKIDILSLGYSACCFYNSNLIFDFVMKLEHLEEAGQIKQFEEAT